MNATATLPVADRFALALDGLARSVAARIAGGAMAVAMIVLVWRRVKRVERQIRGMLARFQAGRMVVRTGTRVGGGGGGRRAVSPGLPRRSGWLLPLVPGEAACFAGQIGVVLAEPEMVALLEASPQARRVLRPLCRMLGMDAALLRGGAEESAGAAMAPVAKPVTKRVRKPRPKVDWGRIPLPRGVMAWARREGFGKVPRG